MKRLDSSMSNAMGFKACVCRRGMSMYIFRISVEVSVVFEAEWSNVEAAVVH